MERKVNLGERSYTVRVERGALRSEWLPKGEKTMIVTDSGVPCEYARCVADLTDGEIFTFPAGEESKSPETYLAICESLLAGGYNRKSRIVAVGGGVAGDLAGFVASTYMRGIAFYNVPTTLLSQVDSSVGGKTGVDFCGVKNVLGSFYQPKGVLIDPDLLQTLPERQFSSGMAEILKIFATFDEEAFAKTEKGVKKEDLEEIIFRAVCRKADVVTADERESGLRKVLNFGHTLGHGIESVTGLYHGECVALGMLCTCGEEVYPRLKEAFLRYGLPTTVEADKDAVMRAVSHDKKGEAEGIDCVFVPKIGTYGMRKTKLDELAVLLDRVIR